MTPTTQPSAANCEPTFVLITQCLQNDFFLNPACRLFLSAPVVRTMLLDREGQREVDPDQHRFKPAELRRGPLGSFLEATIGARMRGADARGRLEVINIRDWHEPSPGYDAERRTYGPHCEAGNWGVAYIDGLDDLLDPTGRSAYGPPETVERGSVRIHHVHANSVFDFRPQPDDTSGDAVKLRPSQLETLLDEIVLAGDPTEGPRPVYIAVIGVYTDIKIETLLTGLRSRYEVANLAVSDTLTASRTLERHLLGLDFAQKVLGVEVVHGVNDLVRLLGGGAPLEDEQKVVTADPFARYASFLQDKQNVLAYQHERLREYVRLTEQRAVENFSFIRRSNQFLVLWGSAFLVATLVLVVLAAVDTSVDWKLPLVTGGLSLAQLVTTFHSRPVREMQQNLTNLAVFKMVLESHSLKAALTRFHLTTPQTLRELRDEAEEAQAHRQVALLRAQIDVIDEYDRADQEALTKLGFGSEAALAAQAAADVEAAPPAARLNGGGNGVDAAADGRDAARSVKG